MDIIKNIVKENQSIPKALSDFSSKDHFVIFDIETTGLNPSYNKIILIGMLYFKNNNLIIEQLFAEKSKDERELLLKFINKFNEFKIYISYNGHSFDIPFLNKRFEKNDINYRIDPYMNIDIYKIVRKYKAILGLENCKLKTVENFLGIDRTDTISGRESVELYKKYELTQNDDLKKKILLHNYEDILHLLPTSSILSHLNSNQLFPFLPYEITIDRSDGLRIRIEEYRIIKDFIELRGSFLGVLKQDYVLYNQGYSCTLLRESNSFFLRLPIIKIQLPNNMACTYIDIDKIDLIKENLTDLNANKRNMYLIKLNEELSYLNIHSTVKKLLLKLFKEC